MRLVKGMEHINAQVATEYTFYNTVYLCEKTAYQLLAIGQTVFIRITQ